MANITERTRGPKLEAHQIILRPLITEKGTHQSQHKSEKREHWAPAYSFEVNPWATKTEIKAAVEELFGVRVAKVRTQNRLGKQRRYRFKMGRLSNWKKAIVTLQPDSPVIEFFEAISGQRSAFSQTGERPVKKTWRENLNRSWLADR